MTGGAHSRSNRNAAHLIDKHIQTKQGRFRSNDLARELNNTYRSWSFNANRVGMLLRMNDGVVQVRHGVWKRKEAAEAAGL